MINSPIEIQKFPDEKLWVYIDLIDSDVSPNESLLTGSLSVIGYERHETGSSFSVSSEIVESGSAFVSGAFSIGAAIVSGSSDKKYRVKYTGTTDTGNIITEYLYVFIDKPELEKNP